MNYVAGEGPHDAKLMIVGEAPGEEESNAGAPFVGSAGQFLNNLLHDAGVDRNQCYVTNVLKYRPPMNRFERIVDFGIKIEDQVAKLYKEIEEIKPNAILALGDKALYHLTGHKGIKTYRGSILKANIPNVKVIPTIHPAAFLHNKSEGKGAFNYSARSYVILDIQRAWEESLKPGFDSILKRKLEIARSSADVFRFFKTYENLDIAASDIEAVKNVPSCISFAFNKLHSISIPLIPNLTDTSFSINDIVHVWELVEKQFARLKVVGQNFKYDTHKLENPCGFTRPNLYVDTAMLAHVLYPEFPKALEFLTSIFTNEPYYKSEYKDWVPGKDSYEKVLRYNARDSAVTYEIYEVLKQEAIERGLWEFYQFFNQAHDLYVDIEDCGLRVDFAKRTELIVKYTNKAKKLQDFLDETCEKHVNVNAPKQVAALLYQFLELPRRKDTSEETITSLMQNSIKAEKHQWKKVVLKTLLDLRKTKKTIGNYLRARTDFDGRMRTQYNINGTENGRTSTSKVDSKKRINRPILTGLAFQTLTKHGEVGPDLRSMFVPDPGHVFLQMDFSQAEARIVGVLSEDWDLIEKFNSGIDVHSELAFKISGRAWSGERASDNERFIGKTGRHAYNYWVGKNTFMIQVNTDAEKFGIDLNISSWKAGKILEAVGLAHPKVKDVFHEQITRCLYADRTLYNPFGRCRVFYNRMDDSLIREALAYIPQSTVRDQMLRLMLDFRKEFKSLKRKVPIEAHDAFVTITPKELVKDVAAYLKQWVEDNLIDFSHCSLPRNYKLKLPCDIEIGETNYKDLVKYKP